jgi:citronellol/citronellal dehydrogenase
MSALKNKTIFITGATRGIGKAIALKAASLGANVIVTGKTVSPHPTLEGTLDQTVREIEALGANAVAVPLDVRNEDQIESAVGEAIKAFGGIDILVNNASAIRLLPTENLETKQIDLMMGINGRGTLLMSKACIPALKQSTNPHILMLSPPIHMNPKWFSKHTPYTLSKFSMSMIALGLAAELKAYGIAVNTLWPKTVIATSALKMLGGMVPEKRCRTPQIVADAACLIFQKKALDYSGNHLIDEDILKESGITDFSSYAVDSSQKLLPDLFLD